MEDMDGQVFRVIEISDQRTLLELMCTALAAFKAQFCHLMNIQYKDRTFGLPEEVAESDDIEDADQLRISNLPLTVSDKLELTYDYGEDWTFKLTLVDSREMEKGTGSSYPRLIDGAGQGILEDGHEAYEMVRKLRLTGDEGREIIETIFPDVGKFLFLDMSEFDIEQAQNQLKRNVKKAVKSYRIQKVLNVPEPYKMEFRITLNGFARKLWRRITVSSNDTLDDLMKIILMSFEAEIYHLYDMKIKGYYFGIPSEYDLEPIQDARKVFLFELNLKPGDKMLLTYDYGENWEFTVTYKGGGDKITDLTKYPKILGGKGWGILEDDYYHFNRLISGGKLDEEETDEFMEYYGRVPDLNEFDLEENDDFVRDQMQRIYHRGGQL